MHKQFPPQYEQLGNQQFKGSGIQRYCQLCACHRNQLGGSIQMVPGGLRTWVCMRHKKAVPNA